MARDGEMNTSNPYESPKTSSTRRVEPSDAAACELSDDALCALGATRLALWFFIVASALLLLYTMVQFGFAWRYLSRVENAGNYPLVVLFSMLKGPLAAIYCWQFYSLEQGLKRLVAGGPVESMLIVQRNFWVRMAWTVASFLAVSLLISGYLTFQVMAEND